MKNYKLRYLKLFEDDLYEAVSYITDVLNNPQAAERLIEETENAILERLKMPLAFEPYRSSKSRKNIYTSFVKVAVKKLAPSEPRMNQALTGRVFTAPYFL